VLQAVQKQSTAALDESQRTLDALLGSLRKQSDEVARRGRGRARLRSSSTAGASADETAGKTAGGGESAKAAASASASPNNGKIVAAGVATSPVSPPSADKDRLRGVASWSDDSGDSSDDDGLGGTWSDHHVPEHDHDHDHGHDHGHSHRRTEEEAKIVGKPHAPANPIPTVPKVVVPVAKALRESEAAPVPPPPPAVAVSVTRTEFVRQQFLIMSVLELVSYMINIVMTCAS
jgi:hypothetical protein